MTDTLPTPLPKLYVYDISPWGVVARTIFGLKNVDHELFFVAYHDVATPVRLVGAKQTPILELPDGHAFPESNDIVAYIDKHYGDSILLQPASGREDLAAWKKRIMADYRPLVWPRAGYAPVAEFSQKKSRTYFREAKERLTGPFEELLAKTPELLPPVNERLKELEQLLFSDRHVNASGVSYDDLFVFAMLRGLTLVKGLTWPPKVRAYVEYFAEATDIPLLEAMAQ